MKRFFALVLVLLCMTVSVHAEGIDVDSMDLAALLELHARIDARIHELMDCASDTNTIYQGVYIVGKDITAGRYLFTCNKETDYNYDEDFAYWLYANEEAYATYDRLNAESIPFGESLSVTLEDGMVFKVVQGQASVQKLMTPDWAP